MKSIVAIAAILATLASAAPLTNGEDVGSCSVNGAMSCYPPANGFVTCDNGVNVYRDCGPGTTCYPLNGGVYCDYPITTSPTPSNGDAVGTCPINGAMSCYSGTSGFVTCANHLDIYRDCAPGTTCYEGPEGPYCGYP